MSSDRFPSSIPIPDEAVEAAKVSLLHFSHACERRGYGLLVCGGCGETLNSYEDGAADENIARDAVTAAAPKLYAYWAEGQVPDFVVGFAYEDGTFRCRREPGRCVPATTVLAGYEPPGAACSVCHAELAALGLEERT